MGIRIQKKMGYALTDFEYDKESALATDTRLDLNFFNSEEGLYDLEKEFGSWVVSKPKEAESYLVDEIGVDPMDAMLTRMNLEELENPCFIERLVTHRPCSGDPSLLLFQPLTCDKWSRYGDHIDSYEATSASPEPDYRTKVVNLLDTNHSGIYPYEGFYFRYPDRETPSKFLKPDSQLTKKARKRRDDRDTGIPQGKIPARLYDLFVSTHSTAKGVEDSEIHDEFIKHLKEDWGCQIPPEILLFAHWTGIFTDFNDVYRLKPVLYTYWT